MVIQPAIIKTDLADPLVQAAVSAEQEMFAHYGVTVSERFVTLKKPVMRVRVLSIGEGDPVLVVPGGSGEAFPWIPMLALLKGRRFILLDRPGGGLSDFVENKQLDFRRLAVDTLQAVLDSFEIKRLPVLGSSLGGLWSFWLALDAPSRVTRMVQLGCPALLLQTSAPLPMRLSGLPVLGRALTGMQVPKSVETSLDGLSFMGSSPQQIGALPDELAAAHYHFHHLPAFRDAWTSLQTRVLTVGGAKPDVQLTEAQLRYVQQPVLFIWGSNDPFGSLDIAQQAVSFLPNATLTLMEAGHLPFLDEPAACARLVQEFLSA